MKRVRALFTIIALVAGLSCSVAAVAFQSDEAWLEVRSANFVVYTDTDEEKGERLATRLESVLAAYNRQLFEIEPRAFPVRVLLFDDTDEFQRLVPERVRTELTLTDELVPAHDAYLIQGVTDWFIAARDRSPDDLVDDVGHSLGHLFLARSVLWRPFWLEEAVGEYVRLVGWSDREGDLDPEEAYAVADLLEIVPSSSFDDLDDGGPFRVSAYFLLRVLMRDHPGVLDTLLRDLGLEEGDDVMLALSPEEFGALDARVRDFEDDVIPMETVTTPVEVRDLSVEETFVLRGDLALASGYPAVARGYYQRGGAAPGAQLGLAIIGKLSGPSVSNRQAFEALVALNPEDAVAHYHLGTSAPESGATLDTRIESLERAVELLPQFGRAHAELGWVYLEGGRAEAALDAANRAIALEPEHADRAFELIGEARFALGDVERARTAMETAAALPHIDPATEEHYRLIVPDLYRRIESRERSADAGRVAELRSRLEARADEVDPRPGAAAGDEIPYGLVHYEVTSRPAPGIDEPRLVSGDVPEYSSNLRRNRVGGRVDLELALDRQGRVVSTRVVRSDAPELSQAVVAAVELWRFDPARSDGESTAFSFRVAFTFDLQE